VIVFTDHRATTATRALLAAACALLVVCSACTRKEDRAETRPTTRVRFGMLPYGDHSYAIIGVQKGWFREAGLDLDYRIIKVEESVPYLTNGSLDVSSGSPGLAFAAYETNPGVAVFALGSIFQGWAIMAQPDRGYQNVEDFINRGASPADAVRMAARQLKGKNFAFPSEAAIKPFIDLVFEKAGLKRDEVKSLVLDDPLTVNAMRNKQADFQVGGAPSRLTLEKEGFRSILTSDDLARSARPSPDSRELAVLFPDGWMTTTKYYRDQHDAVLRLASVNFRILQFMKDHPDEAIAIHMPYLSQITGQSFTAADGKIIYDKLDPFFSFDAQKDWFHNEASIYYFKNLAGSILHSFVEQKIYKTQTPTVDDVVYADDIYYDLERLKGESDALFVRIRESGIIGRSREAAAAFDEARKYYDAFDFLDAQRTSQRAAILIGH
jgi:ABC-type nitrate/sulfonate/bicarbonate transport system substrate-binding protein